MKLNALSASGSCDENKARVSSVNRMAGVYPSTSNATSFPSASMTAFVCTPRVHPRESCSLRSVGCLRRQKGHHSRVYQLAPLLVIRVDGIFPQLECVQSRKSTRLCSNCVPHFVVLEREVKIKRLELRHGSEKFPEARQTCRTRVYLQVRKRAEYV